jgi:hypothetical protein
MTITQNAIVMVFGAILASAGVALLSLRKESGENRIKLFGQEFQVSTPALVVFLAGCALFAMPLAIRSENQAAITFGFAGGTVSVDPNGTVVTTNEREPNDQITAPNLIQMGTTIKGTITSEEDRDFFKFKTPEQGLETRVILRKPSTGWNVDVTVYDAVEARVGHAFAPGEDAASFAFRSKPNAYYYVKVELAGSAHGGPYELVIRQE